MEKIRKYIERFFRNNSIPGAYDMSMKEWVELSENAKESPVDAVSAAFLYGYAKGNRACKASIKKGGDAA